MRSLAYLFRRVAPAGSPTRVVNTPYQPSRDRPTLVAVDVSIVTAGAQTGLCYLKVGPLGSTADPIRGRVVQNGTSLTIQAQMVAIVPPGHFYYLDTTGTVAVPTINEVTETVL